MFEFLDEFIVQTGRALHFDSVQLLQQPQPDTHNTQRWYAAFGDAHLSHLWTVEILDLRTSSERAWRTEREPESLLPFLRGPDNTTCQPKCGFACCMACKNTPLMSQRCAESILDRTTANRFDRGDVCSRARWECVGGTSHSNARNFVGEV